MSPHAATQARRQRLTREECDCGCMTCVKLMGEDLDKHDGLPPWYWPGPPPCREEPTP